jgi:hypothetical protein
MSLFNTGVRPAIDAYLTEKTKEKRDYGAYWSASSAGYCMRLNILKRLDVPPVPEIAEDAVRTQRVFEAGHIFHEWAQRITKNAGLSIAQELELQDEDLMVRGHIDDLVLVHDQSITIPYEKDGELIGDLPEDEQHLILYDYKTANSQAFNYKKDAIGDYHRMQLGTYMYMLRTANSLPVGNPESPVKITWKQGYQNLTEGRILTISKDDLRMREHQLLWSPELEQDIQNYWIALNAYWRDKTLPPCTCLKHDGGFMGRRSKKGKVYNPYFYQDTPCAEAWIKDKLPEDWHET